MPTCGDTDSGAISRNKHSSEKLDSQSFINAKNHFKHSFNPLQSMRHQSSDGSRLLRIFFLTGNRSCIRHKYQSKENDPPQTANLPSMTQLIIV